MVSLPSSTSSTIQGTTLRKAIDEARAHWNRTADLAGTVAILVARLSMYQPFRDTNHRTAHAVAHSFLAVNGFKELVPDDDLELTEILAKDRDPYRSIEDQVDELTGLFRRRLVKGHGDADDD